MTNKNSMRYRPEELLRGMLASVTSNKFTESPEALGEAFNQMGQALPIFQQFVSSSDSKALSETVSQALKTLIQQGIIKNGTSGSYLLDAESRAHCKSTKQTLFNRADVAQLEEGAKLFDQKCGIKG